MAKDSKKRTQVVSEEGAYNFQTGMITADLVGRGVPMKQAIKLARRVRDRISRRKEISTDELVLQIEQVLDESGWEEPVESSVGAGLVPEAPRNPMLDGLVLARDFNATSLSAAAIGALLDEVSQEMEREGFEPGEGNELHQLIDRTMLKNYGAGQVRRYRLARWIRTADCPVVIFIGGATGTGKSTLATELAFRLSIRLATSTDMIRETMRAVLSPEVTPGLHDHSFRGLLEGGAVLSDPRERVLAGFHQQAAQVAVGIRAAVRRAVREGQHLIIEGTHLLPPFQSYLPPTGAVHAAGIVMAVPGEARHLARFPQRARKQRKRDPTPYMDAFQSVRWIHDDLLALAEDTEAVVLASGDMDQTVGATLEYLGQILAQQDEDRWLGVGVHQDVRAPSGIRTLFIILDGLADVPCKKLRGRTPLSAAKAPTLRMLAGNGGQGVIRTREPDGSPAQTHTALWRLLGAGESVPVVGRGLLEAMGRGVPVPTGGIVFRGNLATCTESGDILDRRAGRIRLGVSDLLSGLRDVRLSGGLRGSITPGHEHRVVVVLSGPGLSDRVSDTDPGRSDPSPRVQRPHPLDDGPEAARAAAALGELLEIAAAKLARHPANQWRVKQGLPVANCVITRGAARVQGFAPGDTRTGRAALVGSCTTALGVARALGMQAVTDLRMTGNLDTDVKAKLETAAALLEEWPTVVVHIKAPDIAAHDRDPVAKRSFIDEFDTALGQLLRERSDLADDLRIVVTGDHGTSSVTGEHLADDVPLLLATWSEDAEPTAFDEDSAHHGALGLLSMAELSELLWAE